MTPHTAITIFILAIIPAVLWKGWVVAVMWHWFVVPVFGLPYISAIQAGGIILIWDLVRVKYNPKTEYLTDARRRWKVLLMLKMSVVLPALALGIAAVYRQIFMVWL